MKEDIMKVNMRAFIVLHQVIYHLVTSEGVIEQNNKLEYRDPETVESSKVVAEFAKIYQPLLDKAASRRKSRRRQGQEIFQFLTRGSSKIGRKLKSSDIFDFEASRLLQPLEELKINKKIKKIREPSAQTTHRLSNILLPNNALIENEKASQISRTFHERRKSTTVFGKGIIESISLVNPERFKSNTRNRQIIFSSEDNRNNVSSIFAPGLSEISSIIARTSGASTLSGKKSSIDVSNHLSSNSITYGPAFLGGVFTKPSLFYSVRINHG